MGKPGGNKPGGNKPNGNKPNGNKPNNRGQNRPNNRLQQRATSNVQLQDQGQVDLLNQQFQQAQQDFQRSRQAGRSIYGGAADALRAVQRPDFAQTGEDFQAGLSSVAPLFGGDEYMPGDEIGAGQDLGLAFGEAGNTMLANMQAREGMARSGAGREAALAGRYAQDSLLQKFQDTMQGYNNQLGQVRADDPWQIQNESTRLKEQQMTQQLARARMQSDRATSQFLQDYYGSLVNQGNNRGGGRGGGRGRGRGGGKNRPASQRNPRGPGAGTRPVGGGYTPTVNDVPFGYGEYQAGGGGVTPPGYADPSSAGSYNYPAYDYDWDPNAVNEPVSGYNPAWGY